MMNFFGKSGSCEKGTGRGKKRGAGAEQCGKMQDAAVGDGHEKSVEKRRKKGRNCPGQNAQFKSDVFVIMTDTMCNYFANSCICY